MGGVNDMWDIQTFMDDLKSDANEVRRSIQENPSKSNIERQIESLADCYINDSDAPMVVDRYKLRAAYIEYMQAIANAELVFMCRVEASATPKPVAA